MSAQEIRILEIVSAVQEGRMRRDQAQLLLQVSERTLRRYLAWKNEMGLLFVKHGNTNRPPANRKPEEIKQTIKKLISEKYFDFNVLHLQEKLFDNEGLTIKRETLRKWCHELKLVKRSKRRRGIPRYYRERLPQAGLMLQMDGSYHRWFGEDKACLIATIDDATSDVPYAEFFHAEETWACLRVLRQVIARKGIPHTLYTDRAGLYGGNQKRQNFSQMQRACEELGMHILYAHSPQAKGRIERLFQTLQDRLIPEMRLRGIRNHWDANIFLIQEFLPKFNRSYAQAAENPLPAWRQPMPDININQVLCLKHYRQIRNDHTIVWNNCCWRIMNPLTHSLAKYEAEIREYEDGSFHAFWNGMRLKLHPTRKAVKLPPSQADKQDKIAW